MPGTGPAPLAFIRRMSRGMRASADITAISAAAPYCVPRTVKTVAAAGQKPV